MGWNRFVFQLRYRAQSTSLLHRLARPLPPKQPCSFPPTLTPSFTPFPSQSPSATPADTPTFLFFLPSQTATPSPAGSCPFSAPYYVRVRPFAVGSNNWNIYIPNFPKNSPTGFPATLFLQYILNSSAWTMEIEYINLTSDWLSAMANLNGSGWNYLQSSSNGTFFNGTKLGVDTFPGNVLLVAGRKYRHGECWDSISCFPILAAIFASRSRFASPAALSAWTSNGNELFDAQPGISCAQ